MDQSDAKIKAGECVWCRVEAPEPGGYLVTLKDFDIQGFLPSHQPIEIGRVVPATFVCMNGERAFLTYAFIMGTSSRVQFSTASDQENAFAVWADAYPNAIRPRRAIDLFMPAISATPTLVKLAEQNSADVFLSLETSEFTGCVKVLCQKRLSRSALIFHHGRAVGSVYTAKPAVDPYPFEIGVRKLLEDVSSPDTDAEVEMYELPAEIVLAMSSLFLGYVVHRTESIDNGVYAEQMLTHFATGKGTGCFSLLDESQAPCALSFICNGEFVGTYTIADRSFRPEKELLPELFEKHPGTKLLAYILPPAMMTDSVRFGFRLSSDQFKRQN